VAHDKKKLSCITRTEYKILSQYVFSLSIYIKRLLKTLIWCWHVTKHNTLRDRWNEAHIIYVDMKEATVGHYSSNVMAFRRRHWVTLPYDPATTSTTPTDESSTLRYRTQLSWYCAPKELNYSQQVKLLLHKDARRSGGNALRMHWIDTRDQHHDLAALLRGKCRCYALDRRLLPPLPSIKSRSSSLWPVTSLTKLSLLINNRWRWYHHHHHHHRWNYSCDKAQ
jgi:hypothetical protein